MTDDNEEARKVRNILDGVLGDTTPEPEPKKPPRKRISSKKEPTIAVNGNGNNVAGRDIIHTEKVVKRTVAIPQPSTEHITEEQVGELHRLKDEIIRLEAIAKRNPATYQTVWGKLNRHMKVGAMRMIPESGFPKAKKFMQQWIGRLNGTATAKKKSETWANDRKKAIQAHCNQFGLQEWRKAYMMKKFNKESMTELTNDELETLYRTVKAKK